MMKMGGGKSHPETFDEVIARGFQPTNGAGMGGWRDAREDDASRGDCAEALDH